MMEICDRTEGIYADRLKTLGTKLYGRHKYYFYGVKTANGLRYHYEINLTETEYKQLETEVVKRRKYYLGF